MEDDIKRKARKGQKWILLALILDLPVIVLLSQLGGVPGQGFSFSFLFSVFSLSALVSSLILYPLYLSRISKLGKGVVFYGFVILTALFSVIFFILLASTLFYSSFAL